MDDAAVTAIHDQFCDSLAAALGVATLREVPAVSDEPAVDFSRVVIGNPYALTEAEKRAIADGFASRLAAVGLRCDGVPGAGSRAHPLVALGEQLNGVLPCGHQMRYAIMAKDGTGKIVSTRRPVSLARSNQALPAHQDGMGSGARAKVVGLWADSVAAVNPRTFTQNLLRVAVDLRNSDEAAFRALFYPDAVTIVRKTDGVTVVSPALLLDHKKAPRVFFRAPSVEYDVTSASRPAARRGIDYLARYSQVDAPGSAYIELSPPGSGLLFDNRANVHGRSGYQNGSGDGESRILAVAAWSDNAPDTRETLGRAVRLPGDGAGDRQPLDRRPDGSADRIVGRPASRRPRLSAAGVHRQ
jgi:hypothetical protein